MIKYNFIVKLFEGLGELKNILALLCLKYLDGGKQFISTVLIQSSQSIPTEVKSKLAVS
jgi:hypothetical protein